jgi:hypothetical protein
MANMTPDLDVAISFVNADLGFATELRDGIGESLNVFIYVQRQEEIAGTDGLESFRAVFRYRSRLVVILFRESWGHTSWTRVEQEAITDRFLKEGPDFLFVVMMDDSLPPPWLPEKLIRFSLKDFGAQQAIGAIKARALERGSKVHQPSGAFLAQRSQERAEFAKKRALLLRTEEGVQAASREASTLVQFVSKKVEDLMKATPNVNLEYGAMEDWFVLKNRDVAIHCSYQNRIVNVLDEARLMIREMRGNVLLPGQQGHYLVKPHELSRTVLKPDVTRDQGWCWKSTTDVLKTSEQVADACIEQFFVLMDRHSAGEFPPLSW